MSTEDEISERFGALAAYKFSEHLDARERIPTLARQSNYYVDQSDDVSLSDDSDTEGDHRELMIALEKAKKESVTRTKQSPKRVPAKPEINVTEKMQLLVAARSKRDRWTRAKQQAVKDQRSSKFVKQISDEIQKTVSEIAELELAIACSGSHKVDREIEDLESKIEELEMEEFSIKQKIEGYVARLRMLKPHNPEQDYSNNPEPYLHDANIDVEDDYDTLRAHIAKRRQEQDCPPPVRMSHR